VNQQLVIGRDDDVDICRFVVENRQILEETNVILNLASLPTLCRKVEATHLASVSTHGKSVVWIVIVKIVKIKKQFKFAKKSWCLGTVFSLFIWEFSPSFCLF
jgi:hypothetical protein